MKNTHRAVKYKEVSYAYPTSPTAEKAGYSKTGCYRVKGFGCNQLMSFSKIVGIFTDRDEAFNFADQRPEQYGRYSMSR